jgi:hypothetical protein
MAGLNLQEGYRSLFIIRIKALQNQTKEMTKGFVFPLLQMDTAELQKPVRGSKTRSCARHESG